MRCLDGELSARAALAQLLLVTRSVTAVRELVDEVTAVGDKKFQAKCREAFRERQERSSVIIVSHQMSTIRQYCERVALLNDGRLEFYDDLQEAQALYEAA